ncbi:hypothetical protein XarbCFBP7604_15830 [Xanthomonas arboricola]|nr:hypothetical protein XarbCFBP7604_15830 [Xanthomonas arboricola]
MKGNEHRFRASGPFTKGWSDGFGVDETRLGGRCVVRVPNDVGSNRPCCLQTSRLDRVRHVGSRTSWKNG